MTAPGQVDPSSPAERARAITRAALHPVPAPRPLTTPKMAAGRRGGWWLLATIPALACVAWLALRVAAPSRAPDGVDAVVGPAAPALADEPELLAMPADRVRVFRLRAAPQVLVLAFPTMASQAHMLNRVGAFVEKSDTPRDRVLDDAGLARAIAGGHDTPDSYYYAHDYRIADLRRFLATADRDGVVLDPEEAPLRRLAVSPGTSALISLPPLSDAQQIDAPARAAILRHEVSHGLYFTDPDYAGYVRRFWETVLTAPLRDRFRRFLGAQGYDTADEDLMRNEMQAYLVHTPDERYFQAAAVGLTVPQAEALRRTFLAGMPPSWLRDESR